MKDERVYLGHIRDAITDIEEYTSAGRDAFMAERMRQDAVIRKLEIIGEAVKQLADSYEGASPGDPWKQIAGMRDRLTHDYFGVDLALVWRVVERDLHPLKSAGSPPCARSWDAKRIRIWRRIDTIASSAAAGGIRSCSSIHGPVKTASSAIGSVFVRCVWRAGRITLTGHCQMLSTRPRGFVHQQAPDVREVEPTAPGESSIADGGCELNATVA